MARPATIIAATLLLAASPPRASNGLRISTAYAISQQSIDTFAACIARDGAMGHATTVVPNEGGLDIDARTVGIITRGGLIWTYRLRPTPDGVKLDLGHKGITSQKMALKVIRKAIAKCDTGATLHAM